MKINRLAEIEQYITANQTVSLDRLCEVFNISKNTVRRDVNELVKLGSVKKVYGGVTVARKFLVPFEERNIKNKSEKLAIAREAAEQVKDGDVIFVDSGTTAPNMVSFLKGKSVTVITESLNTVLNALPFAQLKVIVPGGSLIRETNSLSAMNSSAIRTFNINKAFLSTTGLTVGNGVTNSSPLEYEIKKEIAEKSDEVYLLADHSKFGVSSLMTYCRLEDIDCLVTDRTPPEEFLSFLETSRIVLKIAAPAEERT
jgi:DeoR family myo-inositol catabolism operon transcriptional repressor